MKSFKKNILCIGAGYVGGPTMAVIALKCPEYRVMVVDINFEKIRRWNSDDLPIYEPGLAEVVAATRGKNLFFSTEIAKAIDEADIIFVSVNTPTKTFGHGAGMASDLQYWEQTAFQIIEHSRTDKIIVEKSTLPVKTAQAMERILQANDKGLRFEVVSNPEFLSEGTAVKDLLEADRVLVGAHETPSGRQAAEEIAEIYSHWLAKEKIITTNLWSSELSKLVANAFLAQRISSINSMTPLCELTGARIDEIAYAVGTDSRIGGKFLQASVGFGGSCFKKDILNLVYICRSFHLHETADYWEQVVKLNDYQIGRFVRAMVQNLFNTVANKRIALFGFAFKANTGDTRESAAIYVARKLLEERALVVISDPKALDNARIDLADHQERIVFEEDPYLAAQNAQAIALLTEWELYRGLDYRKIFQSMKKPAFIFDGRNLLNHSELYEIGFNVFPIGKPALSHLD